jgi:hypothetical protein
MFIFRPLTVCPHLTVLIFRAYREVKTQISNIFHGTTNDVLLLFESFFFLILVTMYQCHNRWYL